MSSIPVNHILPSAAVWRVRARAEPGLRVGAAQQAQGVAHAQHQGEGALHQVGVIIIIIIIIITIIISGCSCG